MRKCLIPIICPEKLNDIAFFPEEQEHKIHMSLMMHPLQNCFSNCGNKKYYLGIIFKFSHSVALRNSERRGNS